MYSLLSFFSRDCAAFPSFFYRRKQVTLELDVGVQQVLYSLLLSIGILRGLGDIGTALARIEVGIVRVRSWVSIIACSVIMLFFLNISPVEIITLLF